MEWAFKVLGIPGLQPELATTMQTDIVKSAHAAVVLADHKIGAANVFIDNYIAGLRKLFLSRRELPNIRPHLLDFLAKEVSARIARGGQGL
jgi:hypothetical protein